MKKITLMFFLMIFVVSYGQKSSTDAAQTNGRSNTSTGVDTGQYNKPATQTNEMFGKKSSQAELQVTSEIDIENLLIKYSSLGNQTGDVSAFFTQSEMEQLRAYLGSQNGTSKRGAYMGFDARGGESTAYGIENAGLGYGSFDPTNPAVFTTISGGSGTGGFEGAGAISPSDPTLGYVMDSNGILYQLNTVTGVYTNLGNTGIAQVNGMAFNPVNGTLYAITGTSLYTVNPAGPSLTLVGNHNIPSTFAIALGITDAGAAYTYDIGLDQLFSVNLTTGAATLIGSIGFDANFGQGMDWDSSTGTMYMAAFNVGIFDTEIRSVNLTTGATTLIGVLVPGPLTQMGWVSFLGAGGGGGTNPCSFTNPSNSFENGTPNSLYGTANDLLVTADETFTLEQIIINTMSPPGSTILFADLTYYTNSGSNLPGTTIGSQLNVIPTSQTIIGSAFGFDVRQVILDVTPFDFSAGASDTTFWIQIHSPNSAGTASYWEATTATTVGNLAAGFDGATWTFPAGWAGLDGVYEFIGECTGGGGGGGDCSNPTVDINQDQSNTCMATLNQTGIAQSFIPISGMAAGAGIWFIDPVTSGQQLTIELYDNLPNAGGVQLATGTTVAPGGENWMDVIWDTPAAVTIGSTYYIVMTGSVTACMGGTTFNSYPGGNLFANPGYGAFPDWDYTFRIYGCEGGGGGGECEWVVNVNGAGWGDEVTWQLRDNTNTVILSGGPYGLGFNDTQTVLSDNGPMTFYIEAMGPFNDNTPNYSVTANGTIVASGTLPGGTEATHSGLECAGDPGEPGDCETGTFSSRVAFEAAFSGTLNLEDFAGGPGVISGCDGPFNSGGNSCFAPGEILPGISITSSDLSQPDPMAYFPPGGFGVTVNSVGSNYFVDYTIIEFPDNDVSAFGFDVLSLMTAGAGNVEIRIFGTSGLIDTQSINAFNQVFFGYISSEIITRVELEDAAGQGAEFVGMLAFGLCEGGVTPGDCDEENFTSVYENGYTASTDTPQRIATDLTVPDGFDFTLNNIKAMFWVNAGASLNNFDVVIYGDSFGLPNTGDVINTQTLAPSNVTFVTNSLGFDVYEFDLPVTPVPLSGEIGSVMTYWVQLTATVSSGSGYWDSSSSSMVGYPAVFSADGGTTWAEISGWDQVYIFGGDCEEIIPVGNEEDIITGFTFYPNPAANIIYLQADATIDSVEFYNLLGQKVISQQIGSNTSQVDVSGLSVGTYLMTVTSEGVMSTHKVVKK